MAIDVIRGMRRRKAAAHAGDDVRAAAAVVETGTAAADVETAAAPVAVDPIEANLVDAVKAGNSAAFDTLVERHLRRAFAVAYRLLGQHQDAEDVVQDGFIAALVKIDTFERGRPFGPWLLRIVANRALNVRKARALRHTEPLPETAISAEASPFDAAQQSELRGELQRALASLPDQQRCIVELFEIDGFTGPEIAAMLDMAEGTVRWHLHEARRTLRAVLESAAGRTP